MIAVGFIAFYTKRAVIDRIKALTITGGPLDGVQVEYSMPGDLQSPCVYGGRIHLDRVTDVGETDRPVKLETDTVSLYVRINNSGTDVEGADADAERIADVIDDDLTTKPKLAAGLDVVGVTSGDADYFPTPMPEPTVTSILRLLVTVQGHTT